MTPQQIRALVIDSVHAGGSAGMIDGLRAALEWMHGIALQRTAEAVDTESLAEAKAWIGVAAECERALAIVKGGSQ